MKVRFRLIFRMVLIILSISALSFYVSTTVISSNFKKVAYKETFEYNSMLAFKFADIIKTHFNRDFDRVRTIAQLMQSNISPDTSNNNQVIFEKVISDIIHENNEYIRIWDTWELSYLDKTWELPHGRILNTYNNDGSALYKQTDSLDLEGEDYDGIYSFIKLLPEETIENPVWYTPTGKLSDKVLKSSLMVPLKSGDQFIGVVGVDLSLSSYKKTLKSLSKNQEFDVMFFSYNGDIILHPNQQAVGKNIIQVDTVLANSFGILDRIQSGENSSFTLKGSSGNDSVFYAISSFTIAKTSTPWCVLIAAPLTSIESQLDVMLSVVGLVGKYGVIVIIIALIIFAYSLTSPLKRTTTVLRKLAGGDVHNVEKIEINTSDETKEMANSTNTVIDGLNALTDFAENIGQGNYDYEFSKADKDDLLGEAILEMRNSLAKAREEEKQRLIQEDNLNWASQGINIFNRVLRVDNQNLEVLAYEIIQTLTTYIGAHMGGIYVKTDEDAEIYELINHIGFSKEKATQKVVKPGDSNVGLCILEKDTIFINDVPKDYDRVTSGLGSTIPASILIVPLISNLKMVGVIEIESLKEIQDYQISFVEKLAETIAATIATVKVNVRTAKLLDMSQKQAEELEQQEEEMRQNMEEMQATQEEAAKQERDLELLIQGFENILLMAEYDYNGRLTNINDNYLDILKLPKAQVMGKIHKSDVFMEEKEKEVHDAFWEDLKEGKVKEQIEYYKSGKTDYWIHESFLPVKNNHGIVQKILCVGIDITNQKKSESEIKRIQEGILNSENIDSDKESTEKANEININAELKLVDLTYLKMLYKKDGKKIYNILNLYSETLPPQILELEDISKARDYDRLKTRINGLKTKMSYLGLKKIYENFRTIEKIITEKKNINKIAGLLKSVKENWAAASKELDMLLR